MKRPAIFCLTYDKLLWQAFIRSMIKFKAKSHAPWMAQLYKHPAIIDRTIVEFFYTDHPQWIRLRPPRPPPPRMGRGGRQRCLLPWDDEVTLVAKLELRAATGELISVATVIAEIASRTGKRASPQAISNLLKRQGMVRVGVRPLWERSWDCARRKAKRLRDALARGETPTPQDRDVDAPAVGPDQDPPAPGSGVTSVEPPSPAPAVLVTSEPVPELVS